MKNTLLIIITCVIIAFALHLEIRCNSIHEHIQEAMKERDAAIKRAKYLQDQNDNLVATNIALSTTIDYLKKNCRVR